MLKRLVKVILILVLFIYLTVLKPLFYLYSSFYKYIQIDRQKSFLLGAEYVQCLEKSDGVTVAMQDCLTAEDERIEALLNTTYKKVMQAMDEKQKTLLRDSQRAWLKYREGSCDTMMSVLGGTSAGLITTGWRLEMTARRVSWLKDILDNF